VSEPDKIPERVDRLEQSVAEARKDAAAARILAGGADRDVSEMRTELKAHTKALNALRETQLEQGKDIRDLRAETRQGFVDTRKGFAIVESRLAKVEGDVREGFAQTHTSIADLRSETQEGDASIRTEMRNVDASLREEMREGFADVRSEMRDGFALLKNAIERSDES